MAIVGLSKPIFSAVKYDSSGLFSSYDKDNIYSANKATEYSLEFETTDSVNFYANDKVREVVKGTFSTGTLTLSTANLDAAVLYNLLGLSNHTMKQYGSTGGDLEMIAHGDNMTQPDLGVGLVEKHIYYGNTWYRPVIIPCAFFNEPEFTATTQEEEIEFQTREITATIKRLNYTNSTIEISNPWLLQPRGGWASEQAALDVVIGFFNTFGTASYGIARSTYPTPDNTTGNTGVKGSSVTSASSTTVNGSVLSSSAGDGPTIASDENKEDTAETKETSNKTTDKQVEPSTGQPELS